MFNNSQQSKTFSLIEALYPEQLSIALSSKEIEQAKPREQDYSNNWARHNALINRVAVNTISRCLQEITGEKINIWEEDNLHTIWEVVNGTAIELGGKRIILISREDLDTEEFSVPAEWIKIREWIGDYYLAVQVNLEHRWLRVWGCTTHKQIMQMGKRDSVWRNYCLDSQELVSDINAMLIARNYDAKNTVDVPSLDSPESSQANQLITELAQPCSFSPRYKVDIKDWCKLIANTNRLKELYQKRVVKPPKEFYTNLRNWLQGVFEDIWKSDSEVIHPCITPMVLGYMDADESSVISNDLLAISQERLVDLGEVRVALRITIQKSSENQLKMKVAIYPSLYSSSLKLPSNLKVSLLDESENVLGEEITSEDNSSITFNLTVTEATKFAVVTSYKNIFERYIFIF